jgi:hypothetical protein
MSLKTLTGGLALGALGLTLSNTWDGTRWSCSSGWHESNAQLLRPMVDAAARKYTEKSLSVRDRDA